MNDDNLNDDFLKELEEASNVLKEEFNANKNVNSNVNNTNTTNAAKTTNNVQSSQGNSKSENLFNDMGNFGSGDSGFGDNEMKSN